MYKIIRPILFKLDPETAHGLMIKLGRTVNGIGLTGLVSEFFKFEDRRLETEIFGTKFKNPVGLAAGFDKQASILDLLGALGFGHLQVGDTSALPWPGNPKPRLFRLAKDNALINRMGQNNKGAEFIALRLAGKKAVVPLLVSIVKTPDINILGDKAVEDFVAGFKKLYPMAAMSVLNVSCPNTAEGKTFEDPVALKILLDEIVKAKAGMGLQKPVLVKISPDVNFEELDRILEVCEAHKIDGYILTNTAKFRGGLQTPPSVIEQIGKGGLSGRPLRAKATELVRHAYKQLKRPCLVGLGGIDSAEAAYERIKAGASLIQVYTGLIYEGPGLVKKINKGLVKLLERDGFKNISEAVGVEAK
jgi:dihydroorotate dehydrogenase